jgi:hypothetical protein
MGNTRWRRLTEERAGGAKSVSNRLACRCVIGRRRLPPNPREKLTDDDSDKIVAE